MSEAQTGKLVVISGPSGVGKSTICRAVVKRLGAHLNVSMTTRPIGKGEVDGKDYQYIGRQEFEGYIAREDFLEYAEVFGNLYGTLKSQVDERLESEKYVLLEIDVQGGKQVKKQYPEAIMIFLLPPNQSDLAGRISKRGRGEEDSVKEKRLKQASTEIANAWRYYDHMVVNDDLEIAIREVIDIIEGKTGDK